MKKARAPRGRGIRTLPGRSCVGLLPGQLIRRHAARRGWGVAKHSNAVWPLKESPSVLQRAVSPAATASATRATPAAAAAIAATRRGQRIRDELRTEAGSPGLWVGGA